jgi:hypothetical protein
MVKKAMRTVGFLVMAMLVVGSCAQEAARSPDPDEGDNTDEGGSGGTRTGGKGGSRAGGAGGSGKGGSSSGGSGGEASGGSGGNASGGSGGEMTPDAGEDASADAGEPDMATEDMADDAGGDDAIDAAADDGAIDDAAIDAVDMADDVAPSDDAHAGRALMVVGKMPPTVTDMLILARVQGKTMVDVMLETDVTTAEANGRPLVVIPASASVAGTGIKFRDVAVPVLILEPNLLGMMNMTNDTATDHGAMTPETQIKIVDEQSPLAAGLTGTVSVYPTAARVTWGVPGDGALKVATVVTNAARWVIFAYPAGAPMTTGTAPGKRLSFFIHDNVTALTPDAENLLDAAIDWSLQ